MTTLVRTNIVALGYHTDSDELDKMHSFVELLCNHFDCIFVSGDHDDYEGTLTCVLEGQKHNLTAILDYWGGKDADPKLQAKVDSHNKKWDAWINGDGDPFVSHPLEEDDDDA